MEDVSMGMWVEKFNRTHRPVKYSHDFRLYQSGCFDCTTGALPVPAAHDLLVEEIAIWERSMLQCQMTIKSSSSFAESNSKMFQLLILTLPLAR